MQKTKLRKKSYNEEIAEAFYNSHVQHRMEQEGYSNLSFEEAYLFKVKGSTFLLDLFITAFHYSVACAEHLIIPKDSEFFGEMNIRNRDLLCTKLARIIYEKNEFCRVEILPYLRNWEESDMIRKFVALNENYATLRNGSSFRKFIKEHVCCSLRRR